MESDSEEKLSLLAFQKNRVYDNIDDISKTYERSKSNKKKITLELIWKNILRFE